MPIVQQFVVEQTTAYLSKKMQTEVEIGELQLHFFLDVELKDVLIKDHRKADFLKVESIYLELDFIKVLSSDFGFRSIRLIRPEVNMCWYEGEDDFNFKILFKAFATDEKEDKTSSVPFILRVKHLFLYDAKYSLVNENKDIKIEKAINFNNLQAEKIFLHAKDLIFSASTLSASIEKLSLKERSGFVLKEMKSPNIMLTPSYFFADKLSLRTNNSEIIMKFAMFYSSVKDFQDFVNKVKLGADFSRAKISMQDIAYFAEALDGMNNMLSLGGKVYGSINDLHTKEFFLHFGILSRLRGNFHLQNLADFDQFYTKSEIHYLSIGPRDIHDIYLPGGEKLKLNENIRSMGIVRAQGFVEGDLEDLNANLNVQSRLGNAVFDAHLSQNPETSLLSYSGNLKADELALGYITDNSDIGKASLDVKMQGSGSDMANLILKVEGNISAINYNNYTYNNIDIDASLNPKDIIARLSVKDKYLDMELDGKILLGKEMDSYEFVAEVNEAHLRKLNFTQRDSSAVIIADITGDFQGNTIDSMIGNITVPKVIFKENQKSYSVDDILFTISEKEDAQKEIRLESDVLDCTVEGKIHFSSLDQSIALFVDDYFPSYSKKKEDDEIVFSEQEFEYSIFFKKPKILFDIFIPELEMSDSVLFTGDYNAVFNTFSLKGGAEHIGYKNIQFQDFFIKGESFNSNIYVNLGSSFVGINDSLGIENLYLNTIAYDDSINYSLFWDNNEEIHQNSGDLRGYFSFADINSIRSKIVYGLVTIDDMQWAFDNQNKIRFIGDSIILDNFSMYHKKQSLSINGIISPNPNDVLKLNFSDFNVSNLDSLFAQYQLNLDGFLSGDIRLSDIYEQPKFMANLSLKSLSMNKVKLGDLTMSSVWDAQKKAVFNKINLLYKGSVGEIQPLLVEGYFYPENKKNYLDIDAHFDNFNVEIISPYLSSFASDFEGKAFGDIHLSGRFDSLDLKGSLKILRGRMRIDYLNSSYAFTDNILFKGNTINFDSLKLYDAQGNSGLCNGYIKHQSFQNFEYDISVQLSKLLCLNTNSNTTEMFYGRAFASGLARIYGQDDLVNIAVNVKTDKGTALYIPIDYSDEVYENDFIKFVSLDTTESLSLTEDKTDLSGIAMEMIIDVTPDAEVQIIFDPKVGDIIKGRGSGNISIDVTKEGDYSMLGDYTISSGDYLFTLEGIINKKFEVVPGGTIVWTGDMYDANIDIKAIYPLRTRLYDLVMHVDSSDVYKKSIPVNVVLGMKNSLFNPEISFDIELPNSDEQAISLMESMLSTDQEMNRQVFSLMVLNSFMPTEQNSYANPLASGMGVSTTEMLSNQLSNWLSQISNDFDIGVNYRPGDEITNDQLELALSTQLFNERITIDGNVGVGGNNISQQEDENSGDVVGDVQIEYKLSNRLRIKAYNRSNAIDPLTQRAPYSQGVGVFYRREFDNLKDLFRKKSKK